MLGVWQGVPQIYVDLIGAWRSSRNKAERIPRGDPAVAGSPTGDVSRTDRRVYLAALAFLAGPPLVLLWFKQPVAVVVAFSIVGAFAMPFLAATLLYLNNRRAWMGALANRWPGNAALVVCLVVFGSVCVTEIVNVIGR